MPKTNPRDLDAQLVIGKPVASVEPNPYGRRWAKAWEAVTAAKGLWVPFSGPKAVLKALAGTARTNPRWPREVRVDNGTVYIRTAPKAPTRSERLRAQVKRTGTVQATTKLLRG